MSKFHQWILLCIMVTQTVQVGCGSPPGIAGVDDSSADSGNSSNTNNSKEVPGSIDTMEDGDGVILKQEGRIGGWGAWNDGTCSSQTPMPYSSVTPEAIPGGRGDSIKAIHMFADGCTFWGASIGFELNKPGGTTLTYDASKFSGVTFWALGTGAFRFNLFEVSTAEAIDGGICTSKCNDHHGRDLNLTQSWTQYYVPFSQISQQGWGAQAPLNLRQLLKIEFRVFNKEGRSDLWIDDIALYQ
jgi:hypothetical protein